MSVEPSLSRVFDALALEPELRDLCADLVVRAQAAHPTVRADVSRFAAQCRPRSGDAGADTARAVTEVTGLLWSDDEFPLSRVRKSELLDVEYLSDGYPT